FDAETLRFSEANAGALHDLGYSIEELRELTPLDLKPEFTRARFVKLLAPLAAGKRDQVAFETIHRRKDGSTYPVEVRVDLPPGERPPVFVAIVQDITERATAETVLRESERSLAEAQRIAHIGSWEWDVIADTLRLSDETHRIYGLEPGSFSGSIESFTAIVHPDDIELVRAADRAALEDGVPYDVTHRIVRPDGVVRIVHERGEVIRDKAGHSTRLVGTTQDVTERIAAVAERSRLITAIENTAVAIWMHDLDKKVTYVNPSFSRLYGYAPDEIVGQYAGIVDSGRHTSVFFDETFAGVAAGEIWTGTIVNRRKDGSLLEVEAAISPAVDRHGKLTGWVQTDRDVTRERALEGTIERGARERETIEAALERIDPSSSTETIAAVACAVILELEGIDSALVTELGPDRGLILASEGQAATALAPGEALPPERARYLLERATVGPWVEAWQVDPSLANSFGDRLAMTGLHTAAYAPIKGAEGVIGVLGFGVHDAAAVERLHGHVPALTTFASILGALLAPGLETRQRADEARASIQAILDAAAFTPYFQPIVDLVDGTVVGYEALSRFTDGTRPDIAFGLAERSGLGIELETATLMAAIEAASVLPRTAYLSLNASPSLIRSGVLREILAPIERSIVLEVTEHVVVQDYAELRTAIKGLGQDVRLAVDDAGAGYASFRHILELTPAFVKLDMGLVRAIDADPARQALLAGMSYFAVKRKIKLVAEGIETKAELAALGSLGIRFGQGHLLGRPRDGRGPGPWPTNIRWSDPGAGKR
ncbi:MAG: EAL domain-containing protein, partial [Candidatus Limnocylindrales bacterium]